MPTTYSVPAIRGVAMRLTRLDTCGNPVTGPTSVILTEGFISAKFTPQYEEGTETIVKNARGALAINDRAPAVLKAMDVELAMIGINPDALEMLGGYSIVLDNAGNTAGVNYGEAVQTAGVAVELWTDIASTDACAGGVAGYGYLLAPFTTGYRTTGDITVQNDAINATLTGTTKRGNRWGMGPHDVVMNGPVGTQVAGPLVAALDPADHLHWEMTTVAPPVPVTDAAVPLP